MIGAAVRGNDCSLVHRGKPEVGANQGGSDGILERLALVRRKETKMRLLLLTMAHLILLLSIHLWLGGSVSSRIPYAVMMSVVPALIVWTVKRSREWPWASVVTAYIVASFAAHVAQTILREVL